MNNLASKSYKFEDKVVIFLYCRFWEMEKPCRSLEDLLRISLKLTDTELRDWPSNFESIDPERREWLKQAMEGILQNQDLKILKQSLETLKEGGVEETDENILDSKSKAFEVLQQLLDMDHNATDLHLLGGFEVVCRYLKSPVSSLQWRAAEVLAEATQNKPVCQLAAMDVGALDQLVRLLNKSEIEMVKVKSLYALSCITKNCDGTVEELLRLDGVEALMNALKSNFEKVRIKAAFLLMNLTFDDHDGTIISSYVSKNLVSLLINCLKKKYSSAHHHIATLLKIMISRNKEAVSQCRMPEFGLKEMLIEQRDDLQSSDPERYEDEINQCNEIVTICFNAS